MTMDTLATLTQINLDDLVAAFGWERHPRLAAALRVAFASMAKKFAAQMIDFDTQVGASHLPAASFHTIRRYVNSLRVYGAENLPAEGPVLVLANHPGMADTLALFCAINRADLRIIAINRPFLQALPNTSRLLYYVSDHPSERMRAVRQTAAHLKNGGAVLTFPAGQIEPDADVYDGAAESLAGWTDSAGVFVRFAPETRIVPALVRGVLWNKAVKHPLVYLKRNRFEREKLGAAFQLLAHILFDLRPVNISVQFGAPITAAGIGSSDSAALHAAVLEEMRVLLRTPRPAGVPSIL